MVETGSKPAKSAKVTQGSAKGAEVTLSARQRRKQVRRRRENQKKQQLEHLLELQRDRDRAQETENYEEKVDRLENVLRLACVLSPVLETLAGLLAVLARPGT